MIAVLVTLCASLAQSAGEAGKTAISIVPQVGFSNVARSLAFSPDGRWVLSGTYGSIKIWDRSTGRLVRLLTGHSYSIDCLAVSPDGSRIASAGMDGTVKLWDAATGRLLKDLRGHQQWITSIAFSPDGHKILSTGTDRTARLWDADSGALLATVPNDNFGYSSVAFSPDGRTFAVGGSTITLFDSAGGQIVRRLAVPPESLFTARVGFSPDGQKVWVTDGARMSILDTVSGQLLKSVDLAGQTEGPRSMAISPEGKLVLSGRADGSITLWDATSGQPAASFAKHAKAVTALAISPDGREIVSAGEDRAIILSDASSGQDVRKFGEHGREVSSIALSPEGSLLLTGSNDNTLKLWDIASGKLASIFTGHTDAVLSIALSPDGQQAVSGSRDHTAMLWDVASGTPLRIFTGHPGAVSAVAFSPDGGTILSGGEGGAIMLWDVATGSLVRDFARFPGTVHALAFSPDGQRILSGNSGTIHIRLWDTASGALLGEYGYHLDGVHSVAFSSDGRQILSGGEDGRIFIWDIASNSAVKVFAGQKDDPVFAYFPEAVEKAKALEGHYGTVYSAVFSPDGQSVLSGGADGEVIIWDVASGKPLKTLKGHSGPVRSIAISSSGNRLLSGSSDTTVRLWNATGEPSLIFAAGEGMEDWLALTPAGFFNAPAHGTDLIAVVTATATYGVDQFYQALYRPDLVEEKLKGDPLGRYAKAAEKLDLHKLIDSGPPPRIIIKKVEQSGDEAEVTAMVEDQGGGIGKVEWRIDGRTQALERGAQILTPDTDTALTRRFALRPGRNVISITAYNAQGLVASLPGEIVIDAAGISTEKRGTLHVLAVGVDDYADRSLRLGNAAADARALGQALTEVGQNVYDAVKVVPVLDREVTDARLDRVFTEIADAIRPEDKFVFFIAGHGLTVDGRYYFLPQNFEPSAGDTYASKGINQDRWQEWFARIKARSSVLLYDTCESGSVARSASTEKAAAMDRLTQAVGINVIAASDADQPAREGYRGHGLFTWALLDGLANGDENKDSFIEIFELANHVGAVVPKISRQEFGFEQRPRTKTLSNFPLGLQVSGIAPGDSIPRQPDHVLTRAVSVALTKGIESDQAQKEFTLVRVLKVDGDRALIARDGRELGYVPADALAEVH